MGDSCSFLRCLCNIPKCPGLLCIQRIMWVVSHLVVGMAHVRWYMLLYATRVWLLKRLLRHKNIVHGVLQRREVLYIEYSQVSFLCALYFLKYAAVYRIQSKLTQFALRCCKDVPHTPNIYGKLKSLNFPDDKSKVDIVIVHEYAKWSKGLPLLVIYVCMLFLWKFMASQSQTKAFGFQILYHVRACIGSIHIVLQCN